MRALRFFQHGGPETLKIETVDDPVPQTGEVLVRLRARGINRAELLTVRGQYARLPKLPAIPGREGAGEVAALGAGVGDWKIGQRVMLRNGSAVDSGTWCELVRVRSEDLLPTPASLSDAQAGGIFVSYLTAWFGLREYLKLDKAARVIITAASSPTGLASLDLARLWGLQVIATTRQPDRVEFLRAAGARDVVVTSEQNLVDEAARISAGKGVDGAFDAVGGALAKACFKSLREGGTLISYGALSLESFNLKPGALIFSQKTLRGLWLTRILETWPRARLDAIYHQLIQDLASGVLKPLVHQGYPLEQVDKAWHEMDANHHLGKVVLTS